MVNTNGDFNVCGRCGNVVQDLNHDIDAFTIPVGNGECGQAKYLARPSSAKLMAAIGSLEFVGCLPLRGAGS